MVAAAFKTRRENARRREPWMSRGKLNGRKNGEEGGERGSGGARQRRGLNVPRVHSARRPGERERETEYRGDAKSLLFQQAASSRGCFPWEEKTNNPSGLGKTLAIDSADASSAGPRALHRRVTLWGCGTSLLVAFQRVASESRYSVSVV